MKSKPAMRWQPIVKSITGFTILLFYLTASATAQNTTHTVKQGETLYSISQRFDVSVAQLKQWNDLQSNQLAVGRVLVVQKALPENRLVHTVGANETLFSISKKYNVNIAELKSWNNLADHSLAVGQKLVIFPSGGTEPTNQPVVVDTETQQNTYYVVKSGDSLYKIARQHGMTVQALKTLNDLSSNTIRVGQHLTVRDSSRPPSVTESMELSPQGKFIAYRVSGESLDQLLTKFRMSEDEFRALNPDAGPDVRKGQHVTILAPPSTHFENPYLVNSDLHDLGSTSASKYSADATGTPTTSGELYNPEALTAAHPNISLGSVIFVKSPNNQKGIYVRINDRISVNGLKLSDAAWDILQLTDAKSRVTIYQNQ